MMDIRRRRKNKRERERSIFQKNLIFEASELVVRDEDRKKKTKKRERTKIK